MQNVPAAPFSIDATLPQVAPTYEQIRAGRDMLKYQRAPVRISTYDAEIFDMQDPDRRKKYCELMLSIAQDIQAQQAVIWCNERQILQRKDGSSGWFRYIEYSRYALSPEAQKISDKEDEIAKEASAGADLRAAKAKAVRDMAMAGAAQAFAEVMGGRPAGGPAPKFSAPRPISPIGKVHAVGSDDPSDADFFDEMTAWGSAAGRKS